MVAAAIGGAAIAGVAGSAISSSAASDAAGKAADAQTAANENSVGEQHREFDLIRQILAPYNTAGTNALTPLGNLVGANGNDAQAAAIQQVQQSPLFQSQMNEGEQTILQNASATGGLRGGNTNLALARLGQQTLAGTVQQNIGNLGGLVSTGLGAATQTGVAGSNEANGITNANNAFGQQIGNTYTNLGAQQVAAINGATSAITGSLGTYAGLKAGGFKF